MDEANEVCRLRNQLQKTSEEVILLRKEVQVKDSELQALKHSPPRPPPLLWKGCACMPAGVVRPHIAVKEKCVYVGGGNATKLDASRTVYKYDTEANIWSSLPITPYYTFSLALVKGWFTIIGGVAVISSVVSSALASFEEKTKKWCHKFPAMPTGRCAASAISTNEYLVVAGGLSYSDYTHLDIVEVLDLLTLTWAKSDPVPKPSAFMSITVCSVTDRIYMFGGLTRQGGVGSVWSCNIPNLVKSCHEKNPEKSAWEVLTEAPYYRCGGVAVNGKLVVASGLTPDDATTSTVHAFDPQTKQWEVLGEMAASRSSCSVAMLSKERLLIVGGYADPRSWMASLTRDVMEVVNLQV